MTITAAEVERFAGMSRTYLTTLVEQTTAAVQLFESAVRSAVASLSAGNHIEAPYGARDPEPLPPAPPM